MDKESTIAITPANNTLTKSLFIMNDIPHKIKTTGQSFHNLASSKLTSEKLLIKISVPRVTRSNPQKTCFGFMVESLKNYTFFEFNSKLTPSVIKMSGQKSPK